MPTSKKDSETPISGEVALAGILALLVVEREERINDGRAAQKTELVLADAGVPTEVIAALVGKNVAAIRKAVQRARKS